MDGLKLLHIADPDLAETVHAGLDQKKFPIDPEITTCLVQQTIWGLSLEASFGKAVAAGYLDLIGNIEKIQILKYHKLVQKAGKRGPTLGKIMATSLVPVLIHGNPLFLDRFLHIADIMQKKGVHILVSPFDILDTILDKGDLKSGRAYLDLLCDTFSLELTSNQCRYYANLLPKAVLSFSSKNRAWQINQLRQIIKKAIDLADAFLEGMDRRLYLLSETALDKFVSRGLTRVPAGLTHKSMHPPDHAHEKSIRQCKKYLSLSSKLGMETFLELQLTVPISQMKNRLNQYISARTGIGITVRPQSLLPNPAFKTLFDKTVVCSDGQFIYLPDEIGRFQTKTENEALYKCLVRFESANYEFGTFDFDLEKTVEKCGLQDLLPDLEKEQKDDMSDLECFLHLVSRIMYRSTEYPTNPSPGKELAFRFALDLFTLFEHGRIRTLINRHYPGMIRSYLPVLQKEAMRLRHQNQGTSPVFFLYLHIALDMPQTGYFSKHKQMGQTLQHLADLFENRIKKDDRVETCGELVFKAFQEIKALFKANSLKEPSDLPFPSLLTPFHRGFRPDLYVRTFQEDEYKARIIKIKLQKIGIRIYKSDIRNRLRLNRGTISIEDIKELIIYTDTKYQKKSFKPDCVKIDLSEIDFSMLAKAGLSMDDFFNASMLSPTPDTPYTAYRYKEWDCFIGDYLNDHVRVLDKTVSCSDNDFYAQTLSRHTGLIRRLRYAFELLKPEGLTLLRPWREGDDFDYRALLDFGIDKKAGRMPSDRLFIKRLKNERDVAVLLLVDLSRSTSNTVKGSAATVLDIEKEAIVLFCEALEVVGDTFAIAGFSGTGRFGVDYFRIKKFEESITPSVKMRINAMAPQRSTRMGAAIRHAGCQLEKMNAKVRLLMIMGDGFPNDVDYKQNYAIEDTRRSILEVRSKNIHVKAITVNIATDPKLDRIYGYTHHNVLSDIRELPDKLLLIYQTLTG